MSTSTPVSKLTNQVVKAIAAIRSKPTTSNLSVAKKLLDKCDMLHKGGKVRGYKSTDLPSDEKYEELKQLYESVIEMTSNGINSSSTASSTISTDATQGESHALGRPKSMRMSEEDIAVSKQIDMDAELYKQNQIYQRKREKKAADIKVFAKLDKSDKTPILIMDGIELPKKIPSINMPCILMPKFDGCTIAISFNADRILVAHTRGVDSTTGDKKINYVTEKMELLFDAKTAFKHLLSHPYLDITCKDTKYVGNMQHPLKMRLITDCIKEIRIRAECVKKDKNTEDTATGFVSGGINGKLDTFRSRLHNLCLRPFEIGLIVYNDPSSNTPINVIPTQESALSILNRMELLHFIPMHSDYIDETYDFISLLDIMQSRYKEPLDGIVYCPAQWTYPYVPEESSKRVDYCKYKFKRNNIVQSALLGVSYSIGASGKYTPTLQYEPVVINDKTYKQAKMAVKRIRDFGKIYVGQPCDIELKADINPMVVRVYEPVKTDEEITLIHRCLHCSHELDYSTNKQGDIVITCMNPMCPGILRQRIVKFLSTIKYKGISEKTLINQNIIDLNQIEFKNPIRPYLYNLSIGHVYIACGICTATTAKNVSNPHLSMKDWGRIREQLMREQPDDPFVSQVIRFIDRETM